MSRNKAIKQGGTFFGALAQGRGWGAYSLYSPLNLLPEDSLKSWHFGAKTIWVPTMTSRLHCQAINLWERVCGWSSIFAKPCNLSLSPHIRKLRARGEEERKCKVWEESSAPCTGKDESRLDMPASHLHSWRLPWAAGVGRGPTVPESIASYSQTHSTGLNSKWLREMLANPVVSLCRLYFSFSFWGWRMYVSTL